MYILNGVLFDINLPQIVDDNQYPAGWFEDADARLKFGIEKVIDTIPPNFNPLTQSLQILTPSLIDGVWVQQWGIVALGSDLITANLNALKYAESAAIQNHLDAYARSWGYDSIISACTYVNDPFPRFAAEGLVLRDWRSSVWQYVESVATAIELGQIQPPSSIEEALASIPSNPVRPT